MNPICKTSFATVLFVTATCKVSFAQFIPSNYEVGINFGTLIYQGDLAPNGAGYTKTLKPTIGVFVSKSLDEYFSLRANLNIGKITADDLKYTSPWYKQARALNFSTSITELSGTLTWNIFGDHFGNDQRRFSPYLFAGAGLAFTHVKRNWSGFNANAFGGNKSDVSLGLGKDTLHATPSIIPVLPIGAGVKYMLTPQLFFNAEFTYRITATDYLDGFSYVANAKKNDYYYGLTIGISYKFGNNRMNCPKPVR